MSGLRIALVSRRVHPAHGPGGLERVVYDQARHLTRIGVAVDLVTETPGEARQQAAERALGPPARWTWVKGGPLPIGRRPGTVILDRITNYPLWSLRAGRCIDPGVDLVHVHGLGGLGAARLRRSGVLDLPLVLGTHGMEEFLVPNPLKRLLYAPFRRWIREIAAEADRVVVTDNSLRETLASSHGVESERLVTLPNAIDPEACTRAADTVAARRLLGEHAEASLLLVSVGRLAPNKGFDVLARALGDAGEQLPSGWCWVLVGDGPMRPEIERAIRAAGIGRATKLVGAVDDATKHGLLALADWFVHPTLYEGSSLATLEAMAHGLPVLATRAGGLPDKVIPGDTGLLVAPGDELALAAALRSLEGQDGAGLGRAGRRLLEERFGWPALARRHLELYRELVRERRAQS